MEAAKPETIKQLLNEDNQPSSSNKPLSGSYRTRVAEQLTNYFAGNPAKPVGDEFRTMIDTWTATLQDLVPEYRLAEVFIYVRQRRTSRFLIQVEEVCSAWDAMKVAERALRPAENPVFAKDVCIKCNGTGTKLFKAFDKQMGREYTYGARCDHQ